MIGPREICVYCLQQLTNDVQSADSYKPRLLVSRHNSSFIEPAWMPSRYALLHPIINRYKHGGMHAMLQHNRMKVLRDDLP